MFLQGLVGIVNQAGSVPGVSSFGFGITLFVGGAAISGTLVSGREYFAGVADQIKRTADSPEELEWFSDLLSNFFGEVASTVYGPRDDDAEEKPKERVIAFIHLRDARVFRPGEEPMPLPGMWWRGRLDRVDGFTMGSFSTA